MRKINISGSGRAGCRQFVQLLIEFEFQVIDVFITRLEMSKCF